MAHLGDLGDQRRLITIMMLTFGTSKDLSAQTDKGRDRAFDAQIKGEHNSGPRHGLDNEGRPAYSTDIAGSLTHEPQHRESTHQVTHGAAIQPGDRCDVRSRLGAVLVEEAQDGREVCATHLILCRAGK